MADYPCPTCGKLNPIEADVCWFCDTHLTATGPKPDSNQSSDDSGSWLDSLGRKESDPASEKPSNILPNESETQSSEGNGESSDWLARIRIRAQSEQSAAPSASLPERESTPDWLKDVKGADFQTDLPANPDWMDELTPPPSNEQPSEVLPESIQTTADQSEVKDDEWINKVSSWPQPAQEASDSQEPLDHLNLSGVELPIRTPEIENGIHTEDWLSGFQTDLGATESPLENGEDLPDWFKNLEAENTQATLVDNTGMDTLQPQNLPDESGSFIENETHNEQARDANLPGIPEWLGEIPASIPVENPVGQEMPDWLKTTQTPLEPEEQTPVEEPPDWLNRFTSDSSIPAEIQPVSPETPDWLKNFADTGPIEDVTSQPSNEVFQAETTDPASLNIPSGKDWWSKVDRSEDQHISESEEKAPDWLSNVPTGLSEKNEEKLPIVNPPSEVNDSFSDVILPTATPLKFAPTEEEPAVVSPFSRADMPEWLSTFGDKQEETAGEIRAEDATGLTPAELPDWLKAMRPVEAIARNTEDLDREVAKFGPLAGMQGVLPGEKSALLYGKPPVYSNKLEVTDRQKIHAALLDDLLAESRRPQPVQAEPSTLPGRLLRMVAGILLVVAVLVPLLLGKNLFAVPVLYPAAVVDFHNKIESLPENAVVLLVFDYEPGLSGELNNIAQPVLMRLMQKKARLAAVTTIPAGMVMADNLINTVKRDQPEFNLETNYRNLGFLPGNATGVRQFGGLPLQTDFQGISRISDFSAIIIISDSLEGGQAWIEQIGLPMLMISSAQAAPVLQPYYRSGQVVGMLVGLPGAVAYSQITGSPSRASSYWDSYQAGLLVILGLIIVGAIWQLISTLLRRKA